MLLSNSKIDYSSVRRMPSVKLSGQTQGTTTTTTNTMPTSTSLQDISSHAQKFTWNNNNNKKDQQLVNSPEKFLTSKIGRQLNTSQSDERIFEHPEVTIKPSSLDDEIQRRLLTMKTSLTSENLLEYDTSKNVQNILEHPDMRSPVVMQSQISSSSSTALTICNDCKQVSRTQSVDVYTTMAGTLSPGKHVEFFIDNNQNPRRSISPGSAIDDILERSEQEKTEDFQPLSSTTTTNSIGEFSESSSIPIINTTKAKKNDSW